MASNLHGTAHWENGSATARPLPCSPSVPKHSRCLIEEVSAFFTLPNCWSSFATAGSVGFAGRPQGVPEVLPLPDVPPLRIVRCLKDEAAFVRQPGHVPRPSAGRYLLVLDPSCSRRPAPGHLPGSREKEPLGAGSAGQELGRLPPPRAPRQAAVPSPPWSRWSAPAPSRLHARCLERPKASPAFPTEAITSPPTAPRPSIPDIGSRATQKGLDRKSVV